MQDYVAGNRLKKADTLHARSLVSFVMIVAFACPAIGYVFQYNDHLPAHGLVPFEQGLGGWGVFPWVGDDPYSDDYVPSNYYRILHIKYYHASAGYSGPWSYKIQVVYIGYYSPIVIFESDTYSTTCDDCWEEVALDLSLLEQGYPPYPYHVGVIVIPLSTAQNGNPRPLLVADSSLNHPLSTAYVNVDWGTVFYMEEFNEQYQVDFGDMLLDIYYEDEGYTSQILTTFSIIKSLY